MKKFLTLLLGITLAYSCSTSDDGNGNSTTTVVPVTPSNLTGTVASTTQINLSWTDNSTNETGFKIERKTGTGTFAVVGTTATDVTTFNDTGLMPGTIYTYRLYSYNTGGNSPTYSNELLLTTRFIVTDIDGNVYESINIGSQIWTISNLNVSKYKDGTPIPQVSDPTQFYNLTTGAWTYYNSDPANGAIYGKLYNWYAVAGIHDNDPNTPNKVLAPQGWHVPSFAEWATLSTFLGGESIAGGAAKEIGNLHWTSPNTGASNSSGFTGLPGGIMRPTGTLFIGIDGNWWSSTQQNQTGAYGKTLHNNNILFGTIGAAKALGFSVRFVKD